MTSLTGTGKLIRLILRRDRVLLPLWAVLLAVVPVSYVASFNELYPTDAGRAGYAAASASNAGFVSLYGRLFGHSIGELVAWRAGFIPVMIGLFSILTVIRHTRTEEEAGRRELIGSTVTGRHAGLAAALITTWAANLVLGALLALMMIGQHLPSTGSWALGLEFAAAGWVFAAVGGVAAQLTSGAGSARGIALAVLGSAYVLRVAGDVSAIGTGTISWLSWLSPIHWVQQMRPYGGEQWWPLLLAAAFTALLSAVAVVLSGRRDLGAGLLPQRMGPATAAASLRSPLALAWRLHRGLLLSWSAGFAVLGVVMGGLAKGVGDLVRDSPEMADIFARLGGADALIDNYIAGIASLFGLIAAGYGIQAALRLRAEEAGGRAEPILATTVGRLRWAASHLVFALLGPAVVLAAGGLAIGLAHGLNTGDVGGVVPRVIGAVLAQLPAVWVLAGVAILFIGVLPQFAQVSWGALAICLLITLFGGAVQASHWLMDVSPFTHVPRLPAGAVTALPLILLLALAVVLTAGGLVGLRRRDIPVA